MLLALFTVTLIALIRENAAAADPDASRDLFFDESRMTPREREIALLLAEGLSYKEIGARLFLSLSTVQTHVTRIYGKTGVNSKTELSRLLTSSTAEKNN
jgi:DNA-binding CsgD family transcriptional regulator